MHIVIVVRRNAGIMLASAIAVLFASNIASNAHAAQIDAALVPEFDKAVGTFTGTKFIRISYEPGSSASQLFNGKEERLVFSIKGTNASGIAELISKINAALIEAQSPAQVSNVNVTYSGVLEGGPNAMTLTYRVELTQEFSGFKLNQSASDDIPIDVNWRGFVIDGPVLLQYAEHGSVNINQPVGLLEATFPDFAEAILDTEAREIMSGSILDFTEIGDAGMERWHWLFDPTRALAGVDGIMGEVVGRAKVLSVYSLGECSIREGCPPPKEEDATVSVGGSGLKVHMSTHQPYSQIEIAGFTSIEQAGGHQILRVRMENPNPGIPGFTLQVLMVLGGMMGAIAVFVLFKTRK